MILDHHTQHALSLDLSPASSVRQRHYPEVELTAPLRSTGLPKASTIKELVNSESESNLCLVMQHVRYERKVYLSRAKVFVVGMASTAS